MSSQERIKKIEMMLSEGKSETTIVKAVWGRTGGRKDRARREEIRSVKAALDLVG